MDSATPIKSLAALFIPTKQSPITIAVNAGKPVFIVGRNGTGKSALVHRIWGGLGEKVVYLPGSRPSYFDNESLSITPASRRSLTGNFRSWDSSPDVRWKAISGTSRNEKAIHDLQTAETQYKIDAANEIKRDGGSSVAVARLQSKNSPLDRVNSIFTQANLRIILSIVAAELKVSQAGSVYSFAKLSDGERSALILAAEVVSAPAGSVFLVDEPEVHLHASIVVPLLNALIAERPDCGFVISTHELSLPGSLISAQVVLVRGCHWENNVANTWDVDVLESSHDVPDWLRIDLLGARRKILFIEGKESSASLDQPLYALLFPLISIRSRESCREVMRAVAGLRATTLLHHVEAYGLVDHDGMSEARLSELEAEGIFPLPIFAVESLYYSEEVLKAVAYQQSLTFRIPPSQLLSDALASGLIPLQAQSTIEHLASRIAERQMRDVLMSSVPSRESMVSGNNEPILVSVPSPYPTELARITELIEKKDIQAIVARYPVRESGLLLAISKSLRFTNRQDYERAALTRIYSDKALQLALKKRMGNLTAHLE